MKFHIGPIPEDTSFLTGDSSWRPLREPSAFWAQVLSFPLGILAALMLFLLMFLTSRHLIGSLDRWTILGILLLFPLHEGVHLLFHPRQGRSPDSLAGFWPKMLLFYAHWPSEWSKQRFAACLIAPFAVVSLLPILLASLTGLGGPALGWLVVVNAAASSVDLFGILLLIQIPSSAIVRNAGWKTYWRLPR